MDNNDETTSNVDEYYYNNLNFASSLDDEYSKKAKSLENRINLLKTAPMAWRSSKRIKIEEKTSGKKFFLKFLTIFNFFFLKLHKSQVESFFYIKKIFFRILAFKFLFFFVLLYKFL